MQNSLFQHAQTIPPVYSNVALPMLKKNDVTHTKNQNNEADSYCVTNAKPKESKKDKTKLYLLGGAIAATTIGIIFRKNLSEFVQKLSKQKSSSNTKTNNAKSPFMSNIIANNNKEAEDVLKTFDFAQFKKSGLPLKYSRQSLDNDIDSILKSLTKPEKEEILSHFNIDGLMTTTDVATSKISVNNQPLAEQVKTKIEAFLHNNEIDETVIKDTKVREVLNSLVKDFPGFNSMVGRNQTGSHEFSVDIRTLKTLQNSLNDPLYKTLPDKQKTILKYSTLLNDISKKYTPGIGDPIHYSISYRYANNYLKKLKLPDTVKDEISKTVYNHTWFKDYNNFVPNPQFSALDMARSHALNMMDGPTKNMQKIMAKADLKSVGNGAHIKATNTKTEQEFEQYFANKLKTLDSAIDERMSLANIIYDSKFNNANSKFFKAKVKLNGADVEIPVLNFNTLKPNEDLSKYGFEIGTTVDNARLWIHMVEPAQTAKPNKLKAALENTQYLHSRPGEMNTSVSFVRKGDCYTYSNREYGFVMSPETKNITIASNNNTSSGLGKGTNAVYELLYEKGGADTTFVRDAFINSFKSKGIKITEQEYGEISKQLIGRKYFGQINDVKLSNGIVITKENLSSALRESADKLFVQTGSRPDHNETVLLSPRIKSLFSTKGKIEDCSPEFLQFAKDNNLPVILMG